MGIQTQGLMLARKGVIHWANSPTNQRGFLFQALTSCEEPEAQASEGTELELKWRTEPTPG